MEHLTMATQQSPQANTSKRNVQPPAGSRKGSAQPSASATGAAERDETYGPISVLYHALQGAETYAQYIIDAERAGESEIASFFEECQRQENQRATRAKQLLAGQLEDFAGEDEDEEDDEDEE
jgi:hypothetical protein